MTSMLSYGDFDAWLECDGEIMSVYDVKGDAAAREISCFLLAEQGKTFTIHWRDRGSGIASAAYIELDGVTVPGKFLYGSGTSFRSGVRTGPESERPFSFAKVPDQNPSDPPLDYRYDLQKCGKIALWIKKVTLRDHCGANSIVDAIPEPMKGKGRHFPLAVGYEAARPTGYQHELTRTFEPFDNTNPGPEVTFVWRYRDLEWMIINGHNIPGRMLPPPEPSSAHRKKAKGKDKERASRDGDTPSPTVGAKRDRSASESSHRVHKTTDGQDPAEEQEQPSPRASGTQNFPVEFPAQVTFSPFQEPPGAPRRAPNTSPARNRSVSAMASTSARIHAALSPIPPPPTLAITTSNTSTPTGKRKRARASASNSTPTGAPPGQLVFLDPMTLSGQHELLSSSPTPLDISRWIEGQPIQWVGDPNEAPSRSSPRY